MSDDTGYILLGHAFGLTHYTQVFRTILSMSLKALSETNTPYFFIGSHFSPRHIMPERQYINYNSLFVAGIVCVPGIFWFIATYRRIYSKYSRSAKTADIEESTR